MVCLSNVVKYFFSAGFPVKKPEIAVELGISVRTVEAQLYRAMKRLREELAHLRGSAIFWLFLLRGEKV